MQREHDGKRGKAKVLKSTLPSNSNVEPGNANPFNVTARSDSLMQCEAKRLPSKMRSHLIWLCGAIQKAKQMKAASGRHCVLFFRFSHLTALLCEHCGETAQRFISKLYLLRKLRHRHHAVLRQYCSSTNLSCNLAHLGHAVEVDGDMDIWVAIGVAHVCP